MKRCPYCMADIPEQAVKCKHCGEWVDSTAVAGGRGAPSTRGEESPEVRLSIGPPTQGPLKACPYCSAQIPADAWTCMYCKRSVVGGRPLAIGLAVVAVLFVAIFFFGFWLPGWLEMQEKHKQFDQKWNQFPGR